MANKTKQNKVFLVLKLHCTYCESKQNCSSVVFYLFQAGYFYICIIGYIYLCY